MLARWRCRRAVLFCGDEDWNRTQIVDAAWTGATPAAFYLGLCRLRGILSPPAPPRLRCRRVILLCRNDGAAAIPDFKLRLANRCSQEVKSGAIRASILDFRPRLANRCSQKVKTGANRASILDFKPRLGNRCNNASLSRAGKQSTVPHLIFGKVEENL